MKTSELKGAALDWAVAKCEGVDIRSIGKFGVQIAVENEYDLFSPSKYWSQGGPIIERELICVVATPSAHWDARTTEYPPRYHAGPTPLIAAMRCYVASKLGDEVKIPKELM